jgi:GT2 family glycosyltransferase
MSAARTRLSALIVNYNSGAYARACVESLRHEWRRAGRAADDLEVVVVDNASPQPQEAHLTALEALGATVVRHRENAGYAAGMNLAFERTRGAPRDVVAILNPDLHFLPGALDALLGYLAAHPECGVVDPRCWVDEARQLFLPKNALPTPLEHWRTVLAQLHPALCRAYSRRRVRSALDWCLAERPLETDMLSGCCLFLRRDVVARLPALMDPGYPLYFEDTDLFARLRALGYTIVHQVEAHVLHHWSRSAGIGGNFQGEPQRRFEVGKERYYRKFHGRAGWAAVRAADRLAARWPARRSFRPLHALTELGELAEPPTFRFGRRTRFLLEFSVTPTFVLAAGTPGEGESWTFPPETWQWCFQARYFARALDLERGLALLGAWTFAKSTPGRDTPLTIEEALPARFRAELGAPPRAAEACA